MLHKFNSFLADAYDIFVINMCVRLAGLLDVCIERMSGVSEYVIVAQHARHDPALIHPRRHRITAP